VIRRNHITGPGGYSAARIGRSHWAIYLNSIGTGFHADSAKEAAGMMRRLARAVAHVERFRRKP